MKNNKKILLQMNDPVIVQRGKLSGCAAHICRVCKYTDMLWIYIDTHTDGDYAVIPYGPFFSDELILNNALKEEKP